MPSVRLVTVHLCSHADVEVVDNGLDGPVHHTFLECTCDRLECNATDEYWCTEYEPITHEEQDALRYLWRQLGNLKNQLNNVLVVFDATNSAVIAQLTGTQLKGVDASLLDVLFADDRSEQIDRWLFEARDLCKHANTFQRCGSYRPFFEYCLKTAMMLIDDRKKDVATLKCALRNLVPDRVTALRREVNVRPTVAGPRVHWKRDNKAGSQIETLVLGVRRMAVSKTKDPSAGGLVRGMRRRA